MAKAGSVNSRDRRNVSAAVSGDFYPTPPWATRALLEHLPPGCLREGAVLEPAAGNGAMARVLREDAGAKVVERDIYDYAADKPTPDGNFLADKDHGKPRWIISNPPFSLLDRFILRALAYKSHPSIAMLARLGALTSKKRHEIFCEFSPSEVYVFTAVVPFTIGKVVRRVNWGAAMHCWMVWRRREDGMRLGGRTELDFISFDAQSRLERDEDYGHDDGKRTVKELV